MKLINYLNNKSNTIYYILIFNDEDVNENYLRKFKLPLNHIKLIVICIYYKITLDFFNDMTDMKQINICNFDYKR